MKIFKLSVLAVALMGSGTIFSMKAVDEGAHVAICKGISAGNLIAVQNALQQLGGKVPETLHRGGVGRLCLASSPLELAYLRYHETQDPQRKAIFEYFLERSDNRLLIPAVHFLLNEGATDAVWELLDYLDIVDEKTLEEAERMLSIQTTDDKKAEYKKIVDFMKARLSKKLS